MLAPAKRATLLPFCRWGLLIIDITTLCLYGKMTWLCDDLYIAWKFTILHIAVSLIFWVKLAGGYLAEQSLFCFLCCFEFVRKFDGVKLSQIQSNLLKSNGHHPNCAYFLRLQRWEGRCKIELWEFKTSEFISWQRWYPSSQKHRSFNLWMTHLLSSWGRCSCFLLSCVCKEKLDELIESSWARSLSLLRKRSKALLKATCWVCCLWIWRSRKGCRRSFCQRRRHRSWSLWCHSVHITRPCTSRFAETQKAISRDSQTKNSSWKGWKSTTDNSLSVQICSRWSSSNDLSPGTDKQMLLISSQHHEW